MRTERESWRVIIVLERRGRGSRLILSCETHKRGFLCATETALSHQPSTRIDVRVSVGRECWPKKRYGK